MKVITIVYDYMGRLVQDAEALVIKQIGSNIYYLQVDGSWGSNIVWLAGTAWFYPLIIIDVPNDTSAIIWRRQQAQGAGYYYSRNDFDFPQGKVFVINKD